MILNNKLLLKIINIYLENQKYLIAGKKSSLPRNN